MAGSLGAEQILIRHSWKVNNNVGLQKKEKEDKQFLIEKVFYEVEKISQYAIET